MGEPVKQNTSESCADGEKKRAGGEHLTSSREGTNMWDEFMAFRHRTNRALVHEIIVKLFVQWVIYASTTQYVLFQDELLQPLHLLTLILKGLMTAICGLSIYITSSDTWREQYSLPLTWVVGGFGLLSTFEMTFSDTIVPERANEPSTSLLFGAHQTVFILFLLVNAKLILQKPVHHLCLLGILMVGGYFPVMYFVITERGVPIMGYVRSLLPIFMISLTNSYGSYLWLQSEWVMFVQRKRLHFACIRSEEVLTLAMPRGIAHELMVGSIKSRNFDLASVAFLYISNYDEILVDSGKIGYCNHP